MLRSGGQFVYICSCPETLVARLLLGAFSQLYFENREQKSRLNDLKSFEFGWKESSCKVEAYKDGAEENLITGQISTERKANTLGQDSRKRGFTC